MVKGKRTGIEIRQRVRTNNYATIERKLIINPNTLTQSEIRTQTLDSKIKFNMNFNGSELERIKEQAMLENTSIAELIRSVMNAYVEAKQEEMRARIYFKLRYGITTTQGGGEEVIKLGYSNCYYGSIKDAKQGQKQHLDAMIKEMKMHDSRERETAFVEIVPICGLSNDADSTEINATDRLTDDERAEIDSSKIVMRGSRR